MAAWQELNFQEPLERVAPHRVVQVVNVELVVPQVVKANEDGAWTLHGVDPNWLLIKRGRLEDARGCGVSLFSTSKREAHVAVKNLHLLLDFVVLLLQLLQNVEAADTARGSSVEDSFAFAGLEVERDELRGIFAAHRVLVVLSKLRVKLRSGIVFFRGLLKDTSYKSLRSWLRFSKLR